MEEIMLKEKNIAYAFVDYDGVIDIGFNYLIIV